MAGVIAGRAGVHISGRAAQIKTDIRIRASAHAHLLEHVLDGADVIDGLAGRQARLFLTYIVPAAPDPVADGEGERGEKRTEYKHPYDDASALPGMLIVLIFKGIYARTGHKTH